MSQIWLHKDTKYSTADEVLGYQYECAQEIQCEGIENFVEYVKNSPKMVSLDEVCEWLSKHFYDECYQSRDNDGTWIDADELIEDLKKYMEE